MGDEYKDKMFEHLMKIYQDKSQDWVYSLDEVEDNRWSDFDSESEEEDADIGYWGQKEDNLEFAVILMDELTENNLDSHILLKYPKIAKWWGKVLTTRKKEEEKRRWVEEKKRKEEEDKRARKVLIARLTPEERRLLGVK
jgi:hypothetical protein